MAQLGATHLRNAARCLPASASSLAALADVVGSTPADDPSSVVILGRPADGLEELYALLAASPASARLSLAADVADGAWTPCALGRLRAAAERAAEAGEREGGGDTPRALALIHGGGSLAPSNLTRLNVLMRMLDRGWVAGPGPAPAVVLFVDTAAAGLEEGGVGDDPSQARGVLREHWRQLAAAGGTHAGHRPMNVDALEGRLGSVVALGTDAEGAWRRTGCAGSAAGGWTAWQALAAAATCLVLLLLYARRSVAAAPASAAKAAVSPPRARTRPGSKPRSAKQRKGH